MYRGVFLYIVVRERAAILQLFTAVNKALLVRWDVLGVLDLRFDRIDRGAGRHVEHDGLPRQCFHKDLHSPMGLPGGRVGVAGCRRTPCSNAAVGVGIRAVSRSDVRAVVDAEVAVGVHAVMDSCVGANAGAVVGAGVGACVGVVV